MTTPLERFRLIVAGQFDPPPVAQLIGFRMTAIEPGRATFVLDAGPQHASPLGTVHGEILCNLGDAAMGCAHASLLGDGESFTTLELKINFLKSVWSGELTAMGEVVKAGRTIGLTEGAGDRRERHPRRARDLDLRDVPRRTRRGSLMEQR